MEAAANLNEHKEAHEKEKKDERKKRRGEGTQPITPDWKCEEPGCDFIGQMKAGLVNHVRQRHGYGGTTMSFLRSAFPETEASNAHEILSGKPQQKEE